MRVLTSLNLLLLLLSGCSSMTDTSPLPETLSFQEKLLKSLERASLAQEKLARLEQALHPRLSSEWVDLKDVPEVLRRPFSFEWQGPVEPAVRKIAQHIGYQVRTVGVSPVVPVSVNIRVQKEACLLILREMGYQCRGKVDVHVDTASQTIEVRYAPRRY